VHTRKRHLLRWIAVAFAAAATAAPAVQAAGMSPDDRPQYRGSSAALAPVGLSVDDRAFSRATSAALAPTSRGPDDRPFSRSVSDIGPTTVPVGVVVQPGGFHWDDAVIGGAFGLAVALLGTGGILITRHRRSALRTA